MVADAPTRDGLLALVSLCEKIRTAPVTWRDKHRCKYAYVVGQLVGGGDLEETSAWVAVLQAAQDQLKRTAKEANESRRKEKYLKNTFLLGKTRPRRCSAPSVAAAISSKLVDSLSPKSGTSPNPKSLGRRAGRVR
jgi:hypothetical protein